MVILEGVIRVLIFLGYILLVSRMEDIQRTFMYHGAEHKTIHCFENGLELTPENAQTFYTLRPGQFTILFPEDGHAPMIGEGDVRKIIVKVRR